MKNTQQNENENKHEKKNGMYTQFGNLHTQRTATIQNDINTYDFIENAYVYVRMC